VRKEAVGRSDDEVPWWAKRSCFFIVMCFFVCGANFRNCNSVHWPTIYLAAKKVDNLSGKPTKSHVGPVMNEW
jgi:hypothetical protein